MADSLSGPRELRGYLGCPASGVRWNDRAHPWRNVPATDLLHFQANTERQYAEALAHFARLGYVWWAGAEDVCVASLVLPKMDTSGRPREGRERLVADLTRSVAAVEASSPLRRRILSAVLSLDGIPSLEVEQILNHANPLARAVAWHTTHTSCAEDSILALLASTLAGRDHPPASPRPAPRP